MSCNALIAEAFLHDELNGSTSGTVTGTAAYESLADGTQGFDFNGSTRIDYTLPGSFPTRATLFMRVKTSAFVATQSYGQLRDSLGIYRAAGGVGVYSFANGAYQSPTATAVSAGQTLTVAAVYDGTACRSYYNGAAGAFSSVTGNLQTAGNANFRLGQSHTAGNGAIDTISRYMLFTRGLSAAEVAELHNWREPLNTGGTLTASVSGTVLSVAEDTTTWNSQSNGTVTALYTFQYRATSGDAWIGLDTQTTDTSYNFASDGVAPESQLLILRHGVNNGGFDDTQDVASNIVTYSPGKPAHRYYYSRTLAQ